MTNQSVYRSEGISLQLSPYYISYFRKQSGAFFLIWLGRSVLSMQVDFISLGRNVSYCHQEKCVRKKYLYIHVLLHFSIQVCFTYGDKIDNFFHLTLNTQTLIFISHVYCLIMIYFVGSE